MKKYYYLFALLFLGSGILLVIWQIACQNMSNLDESFGVKGRSVIKSVDTTDINNIVAIGLTQDQKILFGGYHIDAQNSVFYALVGRLNSNGEIDTTFGDNGLYEFPDFGAQPARILTDSQNNAYVFIHSITANEPALYKLKPDGKRDRSFGNSGTVVVPGLAVMPQKMIFDSKDRILVTGFSAQRNHFSVYLARFLANGTLDTSFLNKGWSDNLLVQPGAGWGISEDNNHNIIVSGTLISSGENGMGEANGAFIFRLKEDGTLDNRFANNGKFISNIPSSAAGENIIDTDDSILVAGKMGKPDDSSFDATTAISLWKFKSDGSIDSTYGNHGAALLTGKEANEGSHMAKSSAGKILIAGTYNGKAAIVQFTSTGQLDSEYGNAGINYIPESRASVMDFFVQKDDKTVTLTPSAEKNMSAIISRTNAISN